jgi:hypothetical protein
LPFPWQPAEAEGFREGGPVTRRRILPKVIIQAIEIALTQDADFQKTLGARAAVPPAGPVHATA